MENNKFKNLRLKSKLKIWKLIIIQKLADFN